MRSLSMTPAATNGAVKLRRPPCMACDSNQDECARGATISTFNDGTLAMRRAKARAISFAVVNWFSM